MEVCFRCSHGIVHETARSIKPGAVKLLACRRGHNRIIHGRIGAKLARIYAPRKSLTHCRYGLPAFQSPRIRLG